MTEENKYLVCVINNGKNKNAICENEAEMFETIQNAILSEYQYIVYKAKLEKVLDSSIKK